jgi:hypothetical protein
MAGRIGQDVFNRAMCEFAGRLILLQYNINLKSGADIRSNLPVHVLLPFPEVSYILVYNQFTMINKDDDSYGLWH